MMSKIIAGCVLLLVTSTSAAFAKSDAYEMPRTSVVAITATPTDRPYELYIKLPEDYAKAADKIYPVIYTTDAVWHLDMLSGASEYLLPNAILVGISWQKGIDAESPSASRYRDYTLTPFSNPEHQAKYQAGQADAHLTFIRDAVIPHIESNYRADPTARAYFGYSLGGVFGAYALLAQPDTFRYYVLGSPAFSDSSAAFLDALESKTADEAQNINVDVFVSIGELEASEMPITKDFIVLLKRRADKGLALTGLEVIEASDHGTAFPTTVVRSVRWLSSLMTKPDD